jgi:hypothetical protein
VRLEGLGQLKNLMTSSGMEVATFGLVTVPQPAMLALAGICEAYLQRMAEQI